MINNFTRLFGFTPKSRDTSLCTTNVSLDVIWYNARSSTAPISYNAYRYSEMLDNKVIHCTDSDVVERALKYQGYLIRVMGVSIETSARCVLDLYFKDN